MRYNILPTKEFAKDFSKLDNQLQQHIKRKIAVVAEDPTRYKHLHYDLAGSCRIRVEKLRILFSYNTAKRELYLEKIVAHHEYKR
jgi:mRNA-degrading endonuclease RelE of RelBE toxin-antitoxin system